jgi:endonuclease/exonuclease/phosphatase family metal-dependent hydrolase
MSALLAVLLSPAWGDPAADAPVTKERPPELVVETYNAGLAHGFVDYGHARQPKIVEALAGSDADVLCLQEVWDQPDRDAIVAELSATYPHRIVTDIEQKYAAEAPACGVTELFGEDRFVSCMTGACGDVEGDAKTNCIINNCGPALTQLKNENRDCAQALMAQVGSSAVSALWAVVRPFWNAGTYAYGGSDGLMLLSRRPLESVEVLDFTDIATLNRRRALAATVKHDGADVRVYCTHLTADLTTIAPYPGTFPTWADENRAQVDRLITHAAGHAGPVVMLGDFNCGRADAAHGLIGEAEGSCRAFVDAGYADPAAEAAPIECTWCEGNLLNLEGGEHGETVIDHVFLRGLAVGAEGRTLDQPVTIDVDGVAKQTSLSDHFGYRASLFVPPPAPPPEAAVEEPVAPEPARRERPR